MWHIWGPYFRNAADFTIHGFESVQAACGGMMLNGILFGLGTALLVTTFSSVRHNASRFLKTKDPLSLLIARWCVPAGISGLFYAVSHTGVLQGCWWAINISSVCAGLVLIIGLNRENADVYEDVQDKINELEALHVVSWDLVGKGTPDGLVEALALALTEHIHAESAAVYLRDSAGNGLRVAAIAGEGITESHVGRVFLIEGDRRPGFHSGHTAKAFNECSVVVVESIFADVEFLSWQQLAKQEGIVVSVPIVESGETLGVFNLHFSLLEALSGDKIRLLETIAASAGAAIRHMQLTQVRPTNIIQFEAAA